MWLSIAALLVTSGISFVALMKEEPKPKKRWHRNIQLALTGVGLLVGIGISIRTRMESNASELRHISERSSDKQQIAGLTQSIQTQTLNNDIQYIRNQQEVHRLQDQLTDLKKDIATVEIRKKMEVLQGRIDKMLSPPRAKIQTAFWVDQSQQDDPSEIYAPVDNKVVAFSMYMVNHSDVNAAGNGGLWIRICDNCKYSKEPQGFQHVDGALEVERVFKWMSLPAGAKTEKFTIEVEVPSGASGIMVLLTKYRCDNCEIERDWGVMRVTLGTIPFPKIKPKHGGVPNLGVIGGWPALLIVFPSPIAHERMIPLL